MLGEILDDLLISASTGRCITATRHFPARAAVQAPFPTSLDPRGLLDVVDVAASDPLRTLLGDDSIAPADRVALAIAGPAFQWR